MERQFAVFLLRWILNTIGLWVAIKLFGLNQSTPDNVATITTYVIAGLIFSLVNSVIKPIAVILSMPAILVTLGLFTLVVNGFMVYIAIALAPGLSMSFGNSILAGIILSLVNYIISSALDLQSAQKV